MSVHGLHSGAGAAQRLDSLLPGPSRPPRPMDSPFSPGRDRAKLAQPSGSFSLNSSQPGGGGGGGPRPGGGRLGWTEREGGAQGRISGLPSTQSLLPTSPYCLQAPSGPGNAGWAAEAWGDRDHLQLCRQPGPCWKQALCWGLGPAGGHRPEHGWPLANGCRTGLGPLPPSPREQLPSCGGRCSPRPQAQMAGPRGQQEPMTPDPAVPPLPPESLAGSPRQQELWDPPGLGRPLNSP